MRGTCKTTRIALAAGLVLFLSHAGVAEVITVNRSALAVYAGGELNTGSGIVISGSLAAGGDIWIDNDSTISANVYGGGAVGMDQNMSVSGRIVSAGDVWINKNSTVGAIDAGGEVSFGSGVTTAGIRAVGGVTVSSSSQVNGSVQSASDVSLASKSHVYGDVIYGGKYSKNSKAVVDGQARRGGAAAPDTWTTEALATSTLGSQGAYRWYNSNSVTSLASGDYGRFDFGSGSTIYLTQAGTYNFQSLNLGGNVRIVAQADSGEIVINIQEDFCAVSGLDFSRVGSNAVTLKAGGDVEIGSNGQVAATIFNFGQTFNVGSGTVIEGSIYAAGNLWIASNVHVQASIPAEGSTHQQVPEPATLVLLAMGGVTIMLRRRQVA
ncbi:MAG: PEP-CTERM sorting domain-containing protein [Planctomycetaceae bacterium]|nr:PEP-CTERM sorting domain-containing protein [Planctomycetaceae bacterium]